MACKLALNVGFCLRNLMANSDLIGDQWIHILNVVIHPIVGESKHFKEECFCQILKILMSLIYLYASLT